MRVTRPNLPVSAVVRVPAHPAEAHRRVLAALRALPARIVTAEDEDHILARTRMSRRSWGERITVALRTDVSFTEITVRSGPVWRWTVIDYGKGRDNVDFLVRALRGGITGSTGTGTGTGTGTLAES